MNSVWQYIGGAFVTGFFTVLVLLLNRHFAKTDKKEDKSLERDKHIEKLEKSLKTVQEDILESKLDRCRIQMLIMMNHYPSEKTEIMKLAEHYFVTLHGDWYMTGIFNKWLIDNYIGKPEWFNSEG